MDLTFATTKLRKEMNEAKSMTRTYGPLQAKRLQVVLTSLRAATTLAVFAPPYSPPHRCHELTGNLKGMLSMDLMHPYRLLFEVADLPVPQRPEGGLDWTQVTAIKIMKVENTHG
jgi:plasmid maintenance system killer protein